MGSLRGGLISAVALTPGTAFADACATLRPDWDGIPVTDLGEAMGLLAHPVSLALLVATAFVIRFRAQWGALALFVLWTGWMSALAFIDFTGGLQDAARAEGCVGSPTLFIAAVAAICVAMILYTVPRPKRDDQSET